MIATIFIYLCIRIANGAKPPISQSAEAAGLMNIIGVRS